MRFKKVFAVFIAIFWSCVQTNPVQSEQQCGRKFVASGLVFGGSPSNAHAWPWLVAFAHRIVGERDFFCSGSLVSAKHVVSAAHCFQNKREKNIRSPHTFLAFVGKHNLKVEDEIGSAVHKVEEVIVHQDWKIEDDRWDADIALIVLLTEVDLSNFGVVGIVCLPPSSEHEVTGEGTISGWGLSEKFKRTYSSTPNELNLPAVSKSVCVKADYRFAIVSSNRTFCAGYVNQNKAACKGDSGSGFYQLKIRNYNLAGVVSASINDNSVYCVTKLYTIFTDVTKFTDWIKNKIDDTKKKNWEEVYLECEPGSTYGLRCKHEFTGPMKRNLKMKTDYELASSTLKAEINFGFSEFIFAGIGESFANLKELDITNGRIKFIEQEDFIGLKKLGTLDLSYNQIEILPDDVFSDLSSLISLKLSFNQINKLPEQIFWNVSSLTELDLSDNQNKELPEQLFRNLPRLTSLDLSRNQIKELPEKLFRNLPSLTSLYLSSNQIKELPEKLFQNLPSLTSLDLSSNQIKELSEKVFRNIPILTSLDLSSNQIKKLAENVFRNLPILTSINLSSNQIKELPEHLLWNLRSLTRLKLDNNQIKELPENLLNNLNNLQRLYFNDNLIEFFPPILFLNKPELKIIRIYNNKVTKIFSTSALIFI